MNMTELNVHECWVYDYGCRAAMVSKSEADKALADKDKEIAELKAALESEKASRYAESVDAGMREMRLKRALYKACANWAMEKMSALWCKPKFENWDKMASKCLAMAERHGEGK